MLEACSGSIPIYSRASNLTDNVKRHRLYYGYANEAARFRDRLDLDAPKFVPGDDPHAVVSNFSYP
jgi:hypothetical protein